MTPNREQRPSNAAAAAAALVLLLLLLLPAAGALGGAPARLAAQEEKPKPRTLSVTGEGSVQAKPTLARLRVGVVAEARSARAASEENARKMSGVMDALRKAGVEAEKIQTVELSIQPVYDYAQPEGRPVLRGFQARNVVEASTSDLERLGPVLDAVIAVGGNTLEGVFFDLEDMGAAQAQALERAMADARRKAEALAAAASLSLGQVQQIDAVYGRGPIPVFAGARQAAMEARAEPAPPPVSPGQLTVTSTVQVTYRLE